MIEMNNADAITCRFEVPFEFRILFTEGVFDPPNDLLRHLLGSGGERRSGRHFGFLQPAGSGAGIGAGASVHGRGVWSGGEICPGDGLDIAGLRGVPVAGGEAAVDADVR